VLWQTIEWIAGLLNAFMAHIGRCQKIISLPGSVRHRTMIITVTEVK